MAVDLAHVLQLGSGLDEQVVVDLETQRAHDMEVELGEQVVDSVDRAGGGVLDGQHAKLAEAVAHGAHNAFEGLKNAMSGTSKSLHAAI